MTMKYIVLAAPREEAPVLFPRSFTHSYVAALFPQMRVLSAGFVGDDDAGPACGGRSDSLGISSRPEADTALVRASLGAKDNWP